MNYEAKKAEADLETPLFKTDRNSPVNVGLGLKLNVNSVMNQKYKVELNHTASSPTRLKV